MSKPKSNEKPILYSPEMILAKLGNAKTQTRRLRGLDVVNEQPSAWATIRPLKHYEPIKGGGLRGFPSAQPHHWIALKDPEGLTDNGFVILESPYGAAGTKLWARESLMLKKLDPGEAWCYKADQTPICFDDTDVHRLLAWMEFKTTRHCPSIHMPRWASRFTDEVVSIRVERVRSISREDAAAEGICYLGDIGWNKLHNGVKVIQAHNWPEQNYLRLFDSLNKGGPHNPWVWVIETKPIEEAGGSSA